MATEPAATTESFADPDLERFTQFVLEHAEDGYAGDISADDLVKLSGDIWAFAVDRQPKVPKIRMRTAEWEARRLSVLEVVTDDMPFLVASVLGQLADFDATIMWFGHPIVAVERRKDGQRVRLVGSRLEASPLDEATPGVETESMMLVLFDRVFDAATAGLVEQRVRKVIADVATVVADWQPLRTRLTDTVDLLQHVRKQGDEEWSEEVDEACAFLEWLAQEHFVLLGARDYIRTETDGGDLFPDDASGLGILRDPEARILRREGEPIAVTPAIEAFLSGPLPIQITKANVRSTVHRRVYMDYVGVKLFGDGKVIGERRFVGLFTSEAYNRTPDQIPLLRRKIATVLDRCNFAPNSHNRNALAHILETFPRDELFQISLDELFETSTGIMRLMERPRPRVFLRFDGFDRFISALVFLPRERYSSEVRGRIGELLKDAFDGRVSAFYPLLGDSPLVRVHYIIGRNPGPRPDVSAADIEQRIVEVVRSWRDRLAGSLMTGHNETVGRRHLARYGDAFNDAYREAFSPEEAVKDIEHIDSLRPYPDISVRVYRGSADAPSDIRVKLYRRREIISLSNSLPVFENLGLPVRTEFSCAVRPSGSGSEEPIWVHEFVMSHPRGEAIDLPVVADLLETAFPVIWCGDAEDDRFNRLIVEAGLSWREASIFRAAAKFLIQTGSALSQSYMEATLAANPSIVRYLLQYFRIRLDPAYPGAPAERTSESRAIETEITAALEAVQSLDEDRILRGYLNVFSAILRTNYFQTTDTGAVRPTLSFKLQSKAIDALPLPRPHVEIFVYSPRVEGVHLRFGPIARGGLRWSDRREDFRTEVLGLVKAQYVKNSVIVPVGAKGGFVPKRLPENGAREDLLSEGVACYRLFIGALLDLTDNLDRQQPGAPARRPANTIVLDQPDPYLVVAADKGTATFSDIANEIAVGRGFWLGDAFASGGSNGYDHKAMGITARGAWEAVKRHFRELGTDIQTTPFTVIGVGDMSGDVFGNGMLLSRKIRLVAAFDHRDIFIDPDPVPEVSFEERKRLFEMPRSSWADYDKEKISKGGGVFSRRQKSISLSAEIRELLGISEQALSPQRLISAILKSQAELLWFGGIGTYVKSHEERNTEVGDAANDAIRVDARDLQAKVVGEGANLGMTQRARIEFSRCGGRANTDAIDNAAGVDCSDHEVNIKILLDSAVAQGELDKGERNDLLREMTDEVAALVLYSNYEQTLALSLAEATAREDVDSHSRFMRLLEREGRLNRAVEFLPTEEELVELKKMGKGLTRSEIAVLMAYSKIQLFDEIGSGTIPDEKPLQRDLVDYFPRRLAERFEPQLLSHQLRREIIATQLANQMVNIGGPTFVARMQDVSGAETDSVARAYVVTREVFGILQLRELVNALDARIDANLQLEMHLDVASFLRRQTGWLLRHKEFQSKGAAELIDHYSSNIARISESLMELQSDFVRSKVAEAEARLAEQGVPQETARQIARLPVLWSACDIVDVAQSCGSDVTTVARVRSEIGEALGLEPLLAAAVNLQADDHWERLAVRRIVEDLLQNQSELTASAVRAGEGAKVWLDKHGAAVARIKSAFDELEAAGSLTAARFALAVGHVRDLVALAGAP